MTPHETLRVISFGRVDALRSQTLWHAIACGVSDGAPPTLSLMQPGESYVSIGYHRSVHELDDARCGHGGLPVFRRMVGGGPVYIDSGQHFFQIVVPIAMVPARRSEAVRALLEPAVGAFNQVGIPARLDDHNEIVAGDRKICGHAAGQVGEAVVVVGNLITSFDHRAAASIVKAPTASARRMLQAQMERFVAATPADPGQFNRAAAARYADALGLSARPGALSGEEKSHLEALDRRFVDPAWVAGSSRPNNRAWRVKVKSGVWVGSAAVDGHRILASFERDRLGEVVVVNGSGSHRRADLAGLSTAAALRHLSSVDEPGLAGLLEDLAAMPPI